MNEPGIIADEYLDINTPENVVFGYQVAGIGSRFLAALIDTILIVILQIVVYLTLLLIIANLANLDDLTSDSNISWLAAIFGLIGFAFLWGYYIFFELLWNGQSPGKRRIGLRVIRQDGTPISAAEAVIRNLVRIIDFLPLYYGVGVISMFIDGKARRLGDLAAGTLVVYDQGQITLESLEAAHAATKRRWAFNVTESEWAHLPLRRLRSRDIELARSFLERRYDIENHVVLAHQLARSMLEKMEAPATEMTEMQAISLLETIARLHDTAGER